MSQRYSKMSIKGIGEGGMAEKNHPEREKKEATSHPVPVLSFLLHAERGGAERARGSDVRHSLCPEAAVQGRVPEVPGHRPAVQGLPAPPPPTPPHDPATETCSNDRMFPHLY